ncbi:acetylornithine deacetylase [Paracoccus thiocyanatus]|uniref:acetylornithine deacetylase n=1 Tax=Paracoccus thiocyanatus TaxID=34006 RepID=UPI0021638123|nr:acetylornithine deacetylase [Paracoccus thiocyanatus]
MSSPTDLLARLVGFPSVVGGPNGDIVGFVADYLRRHGIKPALVPGPEGDRWNLFASIGDAARPGYVLSGHLDVVPAAEPDWQADPFALRRQGDRLIGRGACDMKGFVAAALAMVPELAAMPLSAPIHIALSYDEEAGCRGVPHLLAALPGLCAPPLGAIIGEPSGLVPVLAHKGKAGAAAAGDGGGGPQLAPRPGRERDPRAAARADRRRRAGRGAAIRPPGPALRAALVQPSDRHRRGRQAVNIIPDRAEAQIEARAIHGVDPRAILKPVVAAAGGLAVDWLSSYPALALDGDHPLARLLAELTGTTPLGAVSYGTEAGLYQQAGIPAIICGPGDIARAHRPEEYLTMAELQDACALIRRLGQRLCP